MNSQDKITKARIGLILDHVFFGQLIMRLAPKKDNACPTMWTDGKFIGYGEKFVDKLSIPELTGALAHEVLHCVFDHTSRRNNRDKQIWNIAGDYAINQILIDSELTLPKDQLLDSKYKGKSVDEIYNIIYKDEKEKQGNSKGQGDKSDPGGCGEVRDANNSTIQDDWKVAVTQAANAAKRAGKLPGSLKELIDEVVNPKVGWKELLRRFVESSAKNDYTWMRPNRRYTQSGLYLPSLHSEQLNIAIAIDTSASITKELLTQFVSEINAVSKEFTAYITVICCDTKINSVQDFTPYDEIKIEIKGRGGTKFSPVFAHIEEKALTPKCLIYLTDLECFDFGQAPEYPVLWISPKDNNKVPFGEVIKI